MSEMSNTITETLQWPPVGNQLVVYTLLCTRRSETFHTGKQNVGLYIRIFAASKTSGLITE